jgi:hypothetical protein
MIEILEVAYHAVMESRAVRWLFILVAMIAAYFFAPLDVRRMILFGLFGLGLVLEAVAIYLARRGQNSQG